MFKKLLLLLLLPFALQANPLKFLETRVLQLVEQEEIGAERQAKLRQTFAALVKEGEVILTGPDAEVRTLAVTLQALIEEGLGDAYASRETTSLTAIIHTPMPSTPLCVNTGPSTVQRRILSLQKFLSSDATLYVAYPQGGLEKRSAEEQAIYRETLKKYPHLIDKPLPCASLELVGASYFFSAPDGTPLVFALNGTQVNDPKDIATFSLWLGPASAPKIKSRIEKILEATHLFVYFSPPMIDSHLQGYTAAEREAIAKDLVVVRSVCLSSVKKGQEKPLYIATAGAPGARKSTILERYLQRNPLDIAYIDPDQRSLRFMVHTYHAHSLSALAIALTPDYTQLLQQAYTKWRGGSNYIALTLLEEALAHRCHIAHGTTSTGEHLNDFLPRVKKAGYHIHLLLCSCEDALKHEALHNRKFIQSSPEDAIAKGKLFPERMATYFAHADTLSLYWSDSLHTPEHLAATFSNRTLTIHNAPAYQKFIAKYEADRLHLLSEGKTLPSWHKIIEIF